MPNNNEFAVILSPALQGPPGAGSESGLGSATILSSVTIPSSGSVTVNLASKNFLNSGDFIYGNIRGVEGVLSRTGDVYSFARQTNGSPVSIVGEAASFYPLRSSDILFSVDTVAALRLRPYVTTDEKVFVNGRSNVSDGLWGIYRADLFDLTSVDDGITVVVSIAGTRWKRIAFDAVGSGELSVASSTVLGGIKIGTGIQITGDGTVSSLKYTNRVYVSPNGSDVNDGRSPETALRTIKAAARIAYFTPEVETIYVGTGEYIEDNPIYLPPGTAVIGDNLRRTKIKALNEGRDIFWWSSGCYINYLVFQDNYFGGYGILDTSNQSNLREISATTLNFKVFPGHTLQRLPGIYKDGAGLIEAQRNNIINDAYDYMASLNPGFVTGDDINTCKRDIGYFVDAISNDLKAGGNVNSIKAGQAYRDSAGDLIAAIANEVPQTKQAFIKAGELCKTAIVTVPNGYGSVTSGDCTQVSDTIDNLTSLIISLIDGGDAPQFNSGSTYILMDQEWVKILDIIDNTISVADTGKRGINNPIDGSNTTPTKHVNGTVISQAGRSFRYAVAFPDQGGHWGRGRISVSGNNVTGTNTSFLKETFPGWRLKVGGSFYTIQTINSNTSITLTASGTAKVSKSYKVIPKPEQILLSPYIQNCSNISVLGKAYYDSGTETYDADKTRAGGMLVDGAQLDSGTAVPSNVADAFTQIAFGGIGFHLKNDAYAQLVSVFQVFDEVGVLCESGGYSSITNSATNFGKLGLVAIGFSNAAIPSFRDAIATQIVNQTKTDFNAEPSVILATSFSSLSNGTKTKAIITVNNFDISKLEAGQLVTIAGHTSTPSINGTNVAIAGINFSSNSIEIELNTTYPNTPVNGSATGTITVTSGKLQTKVTVNGFDENPLANYIVKVTGLPDHPSGAQYVVSDIEQELTNGICRFTLQQVIPSNVLSSLAANPAIELRAPSTVNSSSHTYEYVGSGINYNALPINGGRTDVSKQAVEINSGKCYVSATDQDGNFNVGNYFSVNLRTGQIKFAGQLNLGVIDALELLASPGVPIYEFVTSVRDQNSAENTAIATEKGVRDFIVANLGSLFGKQPTTLGGTSASKGQLVQLDAEGVIDVSMVKIPTSSVYTVANQAARLVTGFNGIPLKPGDYVIQRNTAPAPAVKYILTALPATIAENWDVFSTDSFDASAITSGLISAARLGTGTANATTFLNGEKAFVPVVQSLKIAPSSPLIVGTESVTTPVSSGTAGNLEIDITRAEFTVGQVTGSSSLGVVKFLFDDFSINSSSILSIKGKFRTATSPLSFNSGTGALTIQQSTSTQNGFLSSADWANFNAKLNSASNLLDLANVGTARTNLDVYSKTETSALIAGATPPLPVSTPSVLGGIKIGNGLSATGDGTTSITAATNVQSGASYTITTADNGKIVELSNATTVALLLNNNLPANFSCLIMQSSTATVTISSAAGSSLNNSRSHNKLYGQWSVATLYVRSNTTGTNAAWILSGDTKS
jgi:hypothetical protein